MGIPYSASSKATFLYRNTHCFPYLCQRIYQTIGRLQGGVALEKHCDLSEAQCPRFFCKVRMGTMFELVRR